MAEKNYSDKETDSFVTTDTTGNRKLALDILLKALITQAMGRAIDFGRMAIMNDRSFLQFERSVKDFHYQMIDDGIKILKEFECVTRDEKDR